MSNAVEAVTVRALELALDAAALRQRVFAANIANIDSATYAQARVGFEGQLDAAREALAEGGMLDGATLAGIRPVVEFGLEEGDGAGSSGLDEQVAGMAQNAVQYQALVRGLSKHYAMLSAAVSEGRR